MRIVNPTFGLSPAGANVEPPAAAIDWLKDPIVIFGNSKPNAQELLEGVAARIADLRGGGPIDYVFKPSASQAAPAELIESVAGKYRIALLALGD